jgi:tRNA (guanine37-N1)-methyltransferase
MRFDIVTIFPGFFAGPLDYGIVRRAREAGLVQIGIHDLREFTHDRHRTVDDRPFGGGEGMVLKPEPLFEAVESIVGAASTGTDKKAGRDAGGTESEDAGLPAGPGQGKAGAPQTDIERPVRTAVVLLSASGKLFRQAEARRLAGLERVVLLCGRYEGVDERVAEHLATDEISIGDFVLSGGELAAALVLDAVTRLLPGALGNEASTIHESFSPKDEESFSARGEIQDGKEIDATARAANAPLKNAGLLLDYPHYTRPAEFRGWAVPEILIGGNHEEVRRWRQRMALEKTQRNRPDLLGEYAVG